MGCPWRPTALSGCAKKGLGFDQFSAAGWAGLLVDIWNVSNRVARLSANLEPILEFGIVPIADTQGGGVGSSAAKAVVQVKPEIPGDFSEPAIPDADLV